MAPPAFKRFVEREDLDFQGWKHLWDDLEAWHGQRPFDMWQPSSGEGPGMNSSKVA